MRHKAQHDAHALLQVLIARALLEGRTGEASICIPLTDLLDPYDGLKLSLDAGDATLKVHISTSWEATDDVETIIESTFEDDLHDTETLEEEDTHERPKRPNTDKKGH